MSVTHIVIPIYPGVTHLDFTGPHQVFVRIPDAKVTVASLGGRNIEADGLVFAELADLAAIERCEVLCVPGGFGTAEAILNEDFIAQIRRLGQTAAYLTSVCTGSLILGAAGFLRGRRASTHWAWRDLLPKFGALISEARVERDGNIITGGGVTAGIDLAFTIAAELRGQEIAENIQLGLEYAPAPPFNRGRPELARPEVLAETKARLSAMSAIRDAAVARAVEKLEISAVEIG
jgi:cyclohexyl-isocyanide hydratase